MKTKNIKKITKDTKLKVVNKSNAVVDDIENFSDTDGSDTDIENTVVPSKKVKRAVKKKLKIKPVIDEQSQDSNSDEESSEVLVIKTKRAKKRKAAISEESDTPKKKKRKMNTSKDRVPKVKVKGKGKRKSIKKDSIKNEKSEKKSKAPKRKSKDKVSVDESVPKNEKKVRNKSVDVEGLISELVEEWLKVKFKDDILKMSEESVKSFFKRIIENVLDMFVIFNNHMNDKKKVTKKIVELFESFLFPEKLNIE